MNKEKNIKLTKLIELTLAKAFLLVMSPADAGAEYDLKQLWINWFINCYFSLKNVFSIILSEKVLKRTLVCFLIFNSFVFGMPIAKESIGKPYALAKALNVSAATVNFVYIFPLSHLFGYKNILTLPFYGIRDALYNKSQSLYPETEGEKEVNWFIVRYSEYSTFINPLINHNMGPLRVKYKKYDQLMLAWVNELHSHLKPFATHKITDPEIRKVRFNLFINFAFDTYISREMLIDEIVADTPENRYIFPVLRNKGEINKIEDVLIYYNKLKKFAEKNEPDGLEYFKYHTNNYYIEDLLKWAVSGTVLKSKLVNNELSCNDPYIKVFGESFTKLKEYQKDPYLASRLQNLGAFGGADPLDLDLCKACINSKNFKSFKTHLEVLENWQNKGKKIKLEDVESIPPKDYRLERDGKIYKF